MQLSKKVEEPDMKTVIFSKLSDYDVYHMYVPEAKVGRMNAKAPYRTDRHEGSWGLYSRDNKIMWKDFAGDGDSGDCIKLVMKMFGLTYPKALQKIAQDFGLSNGTDEYKRIIAQYSKPQIEERSNTLIQIMARKEYTKADERYWGQFLIGTEQLKAENIHSVTELYINRKKVPLNAQERVYAYEYPGDKFKIYMVDRPKGERWKSNIPCNLIEGWDRLNGDPRVLVTKSKKDRLVLSSIMPYPVISTQNEGISAYTPQVIEMLKGRHVTIMYDADDSGVRACKKICDMHKFNYVNTPRYLLKEDIKDPADWVKARGNTEEIEQFLRSKNIII